MSHQAPPAMPPLAELRADIYRLARFLVHGDDAEDLVQDALLVAFLQPETPRDALAWLRQVVRRRAIDRARQQRRQRLHAERTPTEEGAAVSAEDELFRQHLLSGMQRALEALDEPYRDVLTQRFLLDRTPAQIAEATGMVGSTVRWRIHEALRLLRERMDAHFEGEKAWLPALALYVDLGAFGSPAAAPLGAKALTLAAKAAKPGWLRAGTSVASFSAALGVGVAVWFARTTFQPEHELAPAERFTISNASSEAALARGNVPGAPFEPAATQDTLEASAPSKRTAAPSASADAAQPSADTDIDQENRGLLAWKRPEFSHCAELETTLLATGSIQLNKTWSLRDDGEAQVSVVATIGCYDPDPTGIVERPSCTPERRPLERADFAACMQARLRAEGPPEDLLLLPGNPWGCTSYLDPVGREPARPTVTLALPEAAPEVSRYAAREAITRLSLPGRGSAAAELSVMLCGDYGGYAERAHAVVEQLLAEYPDVELRWLHLPLDLHPSAVLKARAAVAAQNQEQFWEFQELLFALAAADTTDAALFDAAQSLKLDMARFTADFRAPETAQRISNQSAWCRAHGASGTPSFVIGDSLIKGAQNREAFEIAIEAALANPTSVIEK